MPAPDSDVLVWGRTSLYNLRQKLTLFTVKKYLITSTRDKEKIFKYEK